MSRPSPARSPLKAELKRLTEGLSYMSESDFPLKPLYVEGAGRKSLKPSDLPGARKPVKPTDFDSFFGTATAEEDWHGTEEKESVRRYRELVAYLKENLSDLKVYKAGKVEMDVYVVGRTKEGDFAGVTTKVVET
jgi:hypothetical protein